MRFGEIFSQKRRMVVVHHTHLIRDIVNLLKDGDLVFFDDCLFSQYVFLKENNERLMSMNIYCVLGLSPKAVRPESNPGWFMVESASLHRQLNKEVKTAKSRICGDYINGFMSLPEITELLDYPNMFIALHGCCHLKLEDIPGKFKQMAVFLNDLNDGMELFEKMGFKSDIFVYPYAYEPFLGNKILKDHNFSYIFAGNDSTRIPIEDLR